MNQSTADVEDGGHSEVGAVVFDAVAGRMAGPNKFSGFQIFCLFAYFNFRSLNRDLATRHTIRDLDWVI